MVKRTYPIAILLCLCTYCILITPFSRSMSQKPYAQKLGLTPHHDVLKIVLPDFQELSGASILTKVILYFGSLVEKLDDPRKIALTADYPAMSRAVHAALRIDPYNMDGYYFGQAILAWDAGQYKIANELLEYGMKYRTWDWQLPFFAGFNYAYFLNDRTAAAAMYMRAGELSGVSLFKTLAGRYLQEAGQTQLAIDYLSTLYKETKDLKIRKTLRVRIDAFQKAHDIELARDRYNAEIGVPPSNISDLVARGYLKKIPDDPYGGQFYLDTEKNVQSTSKFSFAAKPQIYHNNSSPAPSQERE